LKTGLNINPEKAIYQWDVIHAVHDNTLVFWCVLGDTAQMRFKDVVAI
jgi:hypothetical protein